MFKSRASAILGRAGPLRSALRCSMSTASTRIPSAYTSWRHSTQRRTQCCPSRSARRGRRCCGARCDGSRGVPTASRVPAGFQSRSYLQRGLLVHATRLCMRCSRRAAAKAAPRSSTRPSRLHHRSAAIIRDHRGGCWRHHVPARGRAHGRRESSCVHMHVRGVGAHENRALAQVLAGAREGGFDARRTDR